MTDALQPNFLSILKEKLERDFVPYLPELIQKTEGKEKQDKKQLSRAFSAFAIHKMLDIGIPESARSVVDDFDDGGIDAIYYHDTNKTLYLVQAKFREGAQFNQDDAIKFRNGVEQLLAQNYKNFNLNVRNRDSELDRIFDEADHIQLVIAYIGTGVSQHAIDALKQLTEDKEHHEFARLKQEVEEYGGEKTQEDLLAEQSVGTVNDTLSLKKLQHLHEVSTDTYIGVALVSDLVSLHKKHEKALYERNIRYFLGTRLSDVNKSIQNTLRTAPGQFFYLNNGITVLADEIDQPRGSRNVKKLRLRGLSVINGAQTISSSAAFVANNPSCDISEAKVLVTIIKAKPNGDFAQSVTRARNHQNPVSTGNFASLDPIQERLRRELAYLGVTYRYRPETVVAINDENLGNTITLEQAIKALALFEVDPRYSFWLKNDVARLQDADSSEYKVLFNGQLFGAELVNKVRLFKYAQDVLSSNAKATHGAEGLFYKHGIFVIASVLAKRCRNLMKTHVVINDTAQLLSRDLDQCRQECWDLARPDIGQGRSVLAFFKNQSNTVALLKKCMAYVYGLAEKDEYKAVTRAVTSEEDFPSESVFRYLTSKAPQIQE